MFGIKLRAEVAHLKALAASRGERLTEATRYVDKLVQQRRRFIARQDDLVHIVAVHITSGTSPQQLRTAMERAGFRAELDYALLDLAPNEQPKREATA